MPYLPARSLPFLLMALLLSSPLQAQETAADGETAGAEVPFTGDSGAFIAARVAEQANDFAESARWFEIAVAADPQNYRLVAGALFAELALGNIDRAEAYALQYQELAPAPTPTALFAMVAAEAGREDYAALIAAAPDRRINPLLDGLILAWAKLGEGDMTSALADFDAMAKTSGQEAFGLYHKALALGLAGDFEGAEDILSGKAAGPIGLMRSGVIAHVEVLSQLERNQDALTLLDKSFGPGPDPRVDPLRLRLKAGEPLPFSAVTSARDGMAEAFFNLAAVLRGETDDGFTLLHTRIATHLRPDYADPRLMTASLLSSLGQHRLAAETFAQVPVDTPVHYEAEIGRAQALMNDGQTEAALEVLRALARDEPQLLAVQVALGDALRRAEKCAEALPVYDAALALVPEPAAENWMIFFSRGICHEQQKLWDKAEPDFRQALALNPGQPQVLNYLGYSFVDRGENLEEALEMINQAVAAEPDSGYIIDSLAWAYFRLGRYEDALAPMERASLLEPVDPIVTDHLGDVYWAVGRKLEARFQWRRALSFEPTEKDAARIQRKLEIGLDAVLVEEGAPPLRPEPAADGN